jgi:alpha,alpha-trehalase
MPATIDAIQQLLTDERGQVCRYDTPRRRRRPGRPEGIFLLCTLVALALALAGQPGRACEVFERAICPRSDLGLLAEEIDPGTGEMPGSFPQALSHTGLVDAACAISEAGPPPRSRRRAAAGDWQSLTAVAVFAVIGCSRLRRRRNSCRERSHRARR